MARGPAGERISLPAAQWGGSVGGVSGGGSAGPGPWLYGGRQHGACSYKGQEFKKP